MSFSLPGGSTAVPGSTILASIWNACMNAIAAELNLKKYAADSELPAKGGTGIDTSASTGVPVVDAGTWSVGTLLPVTKGGTGSATAAAALTALGAASAITRYPRGYLFGLQLSNSLTDATNDIHIGPGECVSDNWAEADRVLMALPEITSFLEKRLDAVWAVGSGQGGLDTGTVTDATYHVWMIQRPDTGVVDVLFSQSATDPTMPTAYTKKRRIGSIIRKSGAILGFVQHKDLFLLTVPVYDHNVTNPGTSASLRALTTPVGIKTLAQLQVLVGGYTGGYPRVSISNPDIPDASVTQANAVGLQPASSAGTYLLNSVSVLTDLSAQVRSRLDMSDAATNLSISTHGWIDYRYDGGYDVALFES
jgi:hypothetical protein